MAGTICATAVPAIGRAGEHGPSFIFLRGPWTTLHHRLFEGAKFTGAPRPREYVTGLNAVVRADLDRLAQPDRAAWNAALAVYRQRFLSRWTLDPSFTNISEAVAGVDRGGALQASAVPADVANALRTAEPIQRRTFALADGRDESEWIVSAEHGVRRYAKQLAPDLARIFGAQWPANAFPVHVVPYTDPFGAYSFYGRRSAFIAASSALRHLRGEFAATETLYHEASHAIVSPQGSRVGDAILDAAGRGRRAAPPSLWHAVIFFTVGTLVERIAAARGAAYTMMGRGPGTADVFGRVWRDQYAALTRFWTPWIDGRGSLEGAIRAVVSALPPSR